MITIWKTGDIEYKDHKDLYDKPVRYTMENLLEVASRTSKVNITQGHEHEIIGTMSNFIVEDGLLKAEEPNNLEIKGMGFSPVFDCTFVDMGEYYAPKNVKLKEIGFTKTPRSHIVYNSIEVANEDNKMDDKQLRDALDNNKKLNEDIGVLKSQIKQLKKANQEKEKEIKEIKESYSDSESKLKEYESLKKIEASYNSLISSKRDDLIHQLVGDNPNEAEKWKDASIEQLENTVELLKGKKGAKGITPQTHKVDDGNNPSDEEDVEEEYTDEQFEEDFKNSGL